MPTSITTSYLLPAIVFNPILILHGFNTFVSHVIPSAINSSSSTSPHEWLKALGPTSPAEPYFNVHTNDQLCWSYTALLVFLQLLLFGRVQDNRVRRKSAKAAAKAERERHANGTMPVERKSAQKGSFEVRKDVVDRAYDSVSKGAAQERMNGHTSTLSSGSVSSTWSKRDVSDSDESTQETSEEETML